MADRTGYIGRSPGDSAVTIARQVNTATGVQTSFTFSTGYEVGYMDVYLNGTKLITANDYQATDGSTIDLTTPTQSGDVIEFVAYKAFNLGTINDSAGDFTVGGDLSVNGKVSAGGSFTGLGVYGSNASFTGVVTASSYRGDGSSLTGLPQQGVGIQSGGAVVGSGVTTLNFIGVGNTFKVTGNTVDISIEGGGGGVSTTGIVTCRGIANAENIIESITFDDFYGGGTNYGMIGPITVSGAGTTVTVGAGVSYVII